MLDDTKTKHGHIKCYCEWFVYEIDYDISSRHPYDYWNFSQKNVNVRMNELFDMNGSIATDAQHDDSDWREWDNVAINLCVPWNESMDKH